MPQDDRARHHDRNAPAPNSRADNPQSHDTHPSPAALARRMPAISLGDVTVSRLILGSNPFFGFAHKPGDTADRMKRYYTDDRIMQVMDEAAEYGITAVWTPCYDHWIDLWNRYRRAGGKLKIWIGQPDHPPDQMKDAITACAENGGKAMCIQGARIEEQVREDNWDVLEDWLDHIHGFGLPAGIAAHPPDIHLAAQQRDLPADFYHQCAYQPEDYSPEHLDRALAATGKLEKPVVLYKVLAAGRLSPQEALPRIFEALKPKDGICCGVFPKDDPNQIAELAHLTCELSIDPRGR